MVITYKEVHNKFKLNGVHLSKELLCKLALDYINDSEVSNVYIGRFLLDWFDENSFVMVQTSGTTGIPKAIKIDKQAMVFSALATGDFFDLLPGNTALLCMSTKYIAGKMMLVRAMILGLALDVVTPNSNPLQNNTTIYDFVAMVPLQFEHSISKLHQIRKLIIGGAKLEYSQKQMAKEIKTQIYETYGMTETITHIAAKSITDDFFSTLPNITVAVDNRNCLVINAPNISKEKIVTNDIVSLRSSTSFKWLGRFDNVINSGGVKLFPEQIEEKLQHLITNRFFIAAEPDKQLGERIVLIIESAEKIDVSPKLFDVLDKYERPKAVYFVSNFEVTETNKINRINSMNKTRVV